MGGQRHGPAALHPGKRPGTHCTGRWVGPRASLDGCGKSRPTGIRFSDRPVRCVSLYRLSYPGHLWIKQLTNNIHRTIIPFFTYDRTYFAFTQTSSGIFSLRHGDFFFLWRFDSIPGHGVPSLGFLIRLIGHTTVGRTRLDEWSARRRDLFLTTHNIYQRHRNPCLRRDSNPQTEPASKRPQKHALDGAATETGRPRRWQRHCTVIVQREIQSNNNNNNNNR